MNDCYPCGTPRRRPDRKPTLILSILGLLSLAWLALRSGGKPSRLAYPCQQAASELVAVAFGAAALHWIRPRRRATTLLGLCAALLALVFFSDQPPTAASGRAMSAPNDYRADLYVVHNAGGPSGDHHLGLDALVGCMDANGLPFYKSSVAGPAAGPNGVVGAHDVVLIKVNQQWDERGGTNTDVLKGLIARVLEHPDGFDGEVVIIENTQLYGTLNWANSNAEDHSQSVADVVQYFSGAGKPVSSYFLDNIRSVSVQEYSLGNMSDGYVIGPYDSGAQMKVSYPKFRTAQGRYVSLKYGLWNPGTSSYSDEQFTFLSVPVLKCHGAVYGVTAATKHHMGTMTTGLSTGAHTGVRYGGMGRFLADVRVPDLNILDCIYILAAPNAGPAASYSQATRVDKLIAGKDPIALDMWATTHVLVPTIVANGYSSYPKQDPTNPSSIFRTYLDAAMNAMLAAGITVTNDLSKVDAHEMNAAEVPTLEPSSGSIAFPNPTHGACTIRFAMPRAGIARLEILDASGRRIRTTTQSFAASSVREIAWDGRDDSGRPAPRGVFSYRVSAGRELARGSVARF